MRIKRKSAIAIWFVALALVLVTLASSFYLLAPLFSSMTGLEQLFLRSEVPPCWPRYLILLCALLPIVVLLVILKSIIVFRRRILNPLDLGSNFTLELAGGRVPDPLKIDGRCHPEMNDFLKSLNIIRDRMVSNINRLKVSHARELEARREIEHANALKSLLISRLVPDIRMPLTAIRGFSELMRAEHNPADGKLDEYLDGCDRNIDKIINLVDRLIQVSQIGQIQANIQISRFKTSELADSILERNEAFLQERDVKLAYLYSSDAPEYLATDVTVLSEILTLMIRSLFRASEHGESLSFFCRGDAEQVSFHLRDNRGSLCRERLAEVYNTYKQEADNANMELYSSTVLGLLFADNQAASIGGKITAESNNDAYNELILTFDNIDILGQGFGGEEGRPDRLSASNNADGNGKNSSEEVAENRRNYQILLGEDDRDNALVIKKYLEHRHFTVHSCVRSGELVPMAVEGRFDAIILSNSMRHRNLLELIGKIRKNSSIGAVPVVVLATKMTPVKEKQLQEHGTSLILMKPLDFAELAHKLRHFCQFAEKKK